MNTARTSCLLAGSILMLLAVLMVAVDVGNIYLFRRGLQNAADAGAMAGAQDLCYNDGDAASADIEARLYATGQNLAESADVTVDMTNYSVTVTARMKPTIFWSPG